MSSSDTEIVIGGESGNARERILAIVMAWIVGAILSFRDAVTDLILTAQSQVFGALGDAGGAVTRAANTLASTPLTVLGMIETAAATVALSAGPAAPFVTLLAWGLAAFLLLALFRLLIRVLPMVIPWL